LEEAANDEVEALAVANVHVSIAVRCAHTLDGLEHFLAELLFKGVFPLVLVFVVAEEGLVGKRPRHIHLDLVSIHRWILPIVIL